MKHAIMIYVSILSTELSMPSLMHLLPLQSKWGFTGGIDTKVLPHYGAFDKQTKAFTS